MKKEIVYTDKYALILSDEIPTKVYYDTYIHQLKHTGGAEYGKSSIAKTVVGHLPLTDDAPILEGVPLLPSFSWGQQDDVDELAEKEYPIFDGDLLGIANNQQHSRIDFIKGYNKAKEKYKYTEQELAAAILWGIEHKSTKSFEEFLQSLQQPSRPTHFECEMVRTPSQIFYTYDVPYHSPKRITNSQGHIELVGKYI